MVAGIEEERMEEGKGWWRGKALREGMKPVGAIEIETGLAFAKGQEGQISDWRGGGRRRACRRRLFWLMDQEFKVWLLRRRGID
jgi:hypothetical protein